MTGTQERVERADRKPGQTGAGRVWIMVVLSVLMGFGSMSTDLYLPALPTMAATLHASGGSVEWTISGYLVGFSAGQLVWGPIGDRYGRRAPVAVGLVLFAIGSAGCALSADVWTMIGWRLVQAFGACAGVVLARAMVRDLYARDRAAQMLSTLITIMAVAPLIGPMVGGQILLVGSWRIIFWVLVAVGAVALCGLFTIPETLSPDRRTNDTVGHAIRGYGMLLRDQTIVGYAMTGGLFYVGIYAFISGTPTVFISYYGVPAQLYGLLFGASIAGIMVTNMINVRYAGRVGSDRLLGLGISWAAVAGICSGIAGLTGWGGLFGLAIPLLAYCGASGLIVANSVAGAMARHPGRAGSVSALVGAIQFGFGIAGSGLVGGLSSGTPLALAMILAVAAIANLVFTRSLVLGSKRSAQQA